MFWTKRWSGRLVAGVLAVMTAGAVSLIAAPAAPAAALSEGCLAASADIGNHYTERNIFAQDFLAGETLTVTAGEPWSTLLPTEVVLEVGGVPVDTDTFPGTVSYTFPADVNTSIRWLVDHGNATWTTTCGPLAAAPVAVPEPKPIPNWVQQYARASADEKCLDTWYPSYAMWPNGGKGGWVCTRIIPSLGK